MSHRVQKAEKSWQQVIAQYLLTRFQEPLKGLVSISRVEAAKDLRSAKVFVSVMG
ncbi:MAG: ribosome-binding factor A, partial [Bdellovibrio sp.]